MSGKLRHYSSTHFGAHDLKLVFQANKIPLHANGLDLLGDIKALEFHETVLTFLEDAGIDTIIGLLMLDDQQLYAIKYIGTNRVRHIDERLAAFNLKRVHIR